MFKFLNRKHYSSTMCEMWYFQVQPEFIKNQESWIFQIIHCFCYIGWAKQKAIKTGNDPERVNSENKHFRERMLFSRLDEDNLELRTEHRVLCDDDNFMLNHEWLNISTSLRNDNDLWKRTSYTTDVIFTFGWRMVHRYGPLEKLWGGGEGNFRAARIFFRYKILWMNFFFELPPPPPPPISFLMVRPLVTPEMFGSKEDYFFVIVSMILEVKILIMKTKM